MNASQSATERRAQLTRARREQLGLGPALRRAWVSYQGELDKAMAAAGFDRAFPDGRVLRMCRAPAEMTISQIGRELGITRQGASKLITSLRDRGYVTINDSTTNGREKIVKLAPYGLDYLATHQRAARAIERRTRRELGVDGFAALGRLLEALTTDDEPRLRRYLRDRDSTRRTV
jgi:DNA-binding MarR family transcriptional regulator